MSNKVLINSISTSLIGILGIFLGILMFAISLFLYSTPVEDSNVEDDVIKKTVACTKYANSFHNSEFALSDNSVYEASIRNNNVIIRKEFINNGKNELLEIENIIANCKNMTLISLCIGQKEENSEFSKHGCSNNGLTINLRYQETWSYKPVF